MPFNPSIHLASFFTHYPDIEQKQHCCHCARCLMRVPYTNKNDWQDMIAYQSHRRALTCEAWRCRPPIQQGSSWQRSDSLSPVAESLHHCLAHHWPFITTAVNDVCQATHQTHSCQRQGNYSTTKQHCQQVSQELLFTLEFLKHRFWNLMSLNLRLT